MVFRRPSDETPEERRLRAAVAALVQRVADSVPRGTPHDLAATAREWCRHLAPYDVDLDALASHLAATRTWWPSVADVLQAAGEMVLPPRTTEGCCEDGWVQVSAWPVWLFSPCRHHVTEAQWQAWAAGDAGWMSAR